ncbi:hypothetical protein [Bacillus thuringiensis]|uniref:hypothetical protein n=1 Tax=Bacillus thuringiensis TaxID=1428 RepID=UPI000A36601B|nr:hypothetical protein [Bacillus thuringiensis]OTZ47908.1 hypothetical protein BK762_19690 [Bacillus thuringiensis serovar toumanoffi]
MRFTDKLEVANEQKVRHLVISEAVSQDEMLVEILSEHYTLVTGIYINKEEVTSLVKAMHKHFRRDENLYHNARGLYFNYVERTEKTVIELNKYIMRISELDLQKVCIIFEKWLTHHGIEFEGMDTTREKLTLKISECKKDLQFFTNEKVSIISSITSVTNDTVLDVLVCDLKEANRNIERLEKTLQDCIDRLSQF